MDDDTPCLAPFNTYRSPLKSAFSRGDRRAVRRAKISSLLAETSLPGQRAKEGNICVASVRTLKSSDGRVVSIVVELLLQTLEVSLFLLWV